MIVKWRPHIRARQGPKSRNSTLVPLNRVSVKRTPPASDFGKMAAKIRLFLPRFRTYVLLVYWSQGLSFLLSEQALCKWFFTLTWRLLRFWSKNNCAQKQLGILGIGDSILDLCLSLLPHDHLPTRGSRFPVPVFLFRFRFWDCPWLTRFQVRFQVCNSIPILRLHKVRTRSEVWVLNQESWHFGSDFRYFHLKRALFGEKGLF